MVQLCFSRLSQETRTSFETQLEVPIIYSIIPDHCLALNTILFLQTCFDAAESSLLCALLLVVLSPDDTASTCMQGVVSFCMRTVLLRFVSRVLLCGAEGIRGLFCFHFGYSSCFTLDY